jgi:hypothetical protein
MVVSWSHDNGAYLRRMEAFSDKKEMNPNSTQSSLARTEYGVRNPSSFC